MTDDQRLALRADAYSTKATLPILAAWVVKLTGTGDAKRLQALPRGQLGGMVTSALEAKGFAPHHRMPLDVTSDTFAEWNVGESGQCDCCGQSGSRQTTRAPTTVQPPAPADDYLTEFCQQNFLHDTTKAALQEGVGISRAALIHFAGTVDSLTDLNEIVAHPAQRHMLLKALKSLSQPTTVQNDDMSGRSHRHTTGDRADGADQLPLGQDFDSARLFNAVMSDMPTILAPEGSVTPATHAAKSKGKPELYLIPAFVGLQSAAKPEEFIVAGGAKLVIEGRLKVKQLSDITIAEFSLANTRIMQRMLLDGQLSTANMPGYLSHVEMVTGIMQAQERELVTAALRYDDTVRRRVHDGVAVWARRDEIAYDETLRVQQMLSMSKPRSTAPFGYKRDGSKEWRKPQPVGQPADRSVAEVCRNFNRGLCKFADTCYHAHVCSRPGCFRKDHGAHQHDSHGRYGNGGAAGFSTAGQGGF